MSSTTLDLLISLDLKVCRGESVAAATGLVNSTACRHIQEHPQMPLAQKEGIKYNCRMLDCSKLEIAMLLIEFVDYTHVHVQTTRLDDLVLE